MSYSIFKDILYVFGAFDAIKSVYYALNIRRCPFCKSKLKFVKRGFGHEYYSQFECDSCEFNCCMYNFKNPILYDFRVKVKGINLMCCFLKEDYRSGKMTVCYCGDQLYKVKTDNLTFEEFKHKLEIYTVFS